jgi:hypothetical protein
MISQYDAFPSQKLERTYVTPPRFLVPDSMPRPSPKVNISQAGVSISLDRTIVDLPYSHYPTRLRMATIQLFHTCAEQHEAQAEASLRQPD